MEWELGKCDDKYFLFLIKDKEIINIDISLIKDKEIINIDISKKEAKRIKEQFNIEAVEYPF